MQKFVFLITLITVINAKSCPNLSGAFESLHKWPSITNLVVTQENCSKVSIQTTMKFASGNSYSQTEILLTDSVAREIVPGLVGKYFFDESMLFCLETLQTYQATQTSYWYFDQNGLLVHDKNTYPSSTNVKEFFIRINSY